MTVRENSSALLHDRVIREAVNFLNQEHYDIYTNPGQEKNAGINDNYPDIVMTEKGTTTVKFIIEVETSDSITQFEAETQWKKYATEINSTFYLLVPANSVNKTNEMCKKLGVNVRFAQYTVDLNNNISINFD
jgi:hypothetical protein